MRNLLSLVLLLSLSLKGSAQIDPVLAADLQEVLNNAVSNAGNNGVSAHLIWADGETWSGVAGIGEGSDAITDSTVFHGASTTKLNVATLMLLLAEEGLVDLDASWTDYVSLDVAFSPLITLRQLLNHTSGIADYLEVPGSGTNVISDFNNFYTPQFILEEFVSDDPDFAPGMGFNYSNSNYALAALITESVTGNPVHVELRNRIWDPLGMEHTYYGGYESYTEPLAGVWWNFGAGILDYSDVPSTSMLSYAYGAGNIVSTPEDLSIMLSSLLGGQVLSAASLEEMLDFVPASFASWTAGYGLGIHHFNQADDEVIGHDGYYSNLTDMFHSMNCGFTLVTMTNTQTGWFGIFSPMYDIVTDYCATVGLEESLKSELEIYPNPSQGTFQISSDEVIEVIEVLDMTGKIYFRTEPNAQRIELQIEERGVYVLKLRSKQGLQYRKLTVSR